MNRKLRPRGGGNPKAGIPRLDSKAGVGGGISAAARDLGPVGGADGADGRLKLG